MARVLVFLTAVVTLGCGVGQTHTEQDMLGAWVGEELLTDKTDQQSNDLQPQIEIARHATLTIREDGTFEMSLLVRLEGTWTRNGYQITFHPTRVGNSEVNRADEKGQVVRSSDLIGIVSGESILLSATAPPWVGVKFHRR